MVEKWEGNYKYKSEIHQKAIGHPCTFFTIKMEIFENDTLKGEVEDDIQSGGMAGVGEIYGEIAGNNIFFEKQMPKKSVLLIKSKKTYNKKHPVLIYEGNLVGENKYSGTWGFAKKQILFLGFIPIKYTPAGSGTWEMELNK